MIQHVTGVYDFPEGIKNAKNMVEPDRGDFNNLLKYRFLMDLMPISEEFKNICIK